jgi:hypothetical protein
MSNENKNKPDDKITLDENDFSNKEEDNSESSLSEPSPSQSGEEDGSE